VPKSRVLGLRFLPMQLVFFFLLLCVFVCVCACVHWCAFGCPVGSCVLLVLLVLFPLIRCFYNVCVCGRACVRTRAQRRLERARLVPLADAASVCLFVLGFLATCV